ncbi:hypothetical protein ACROYT_G028021 [Oculina patagonica]
MQLSEENYKLVMRTLQELIHASSLEELTKGKMQIEQEHLHKLVQVWRTWLDLSSRKGNWITEARRGRFKNDQSSKEGIDLYLEQIPKEHKKSASDWFANGILLPKGSASRKQLLRENVSLTGSPAAFNHIGVAQYVGHVLETSAMKLASGQVKFHFLLCNCMEMAPFLPPDRKYDRVTTSNIADYVPLTSILDMCKPVLNTVYQLVSAHQFKSKIATSFQANVTKLSPKCPRRHQNPSIAHSNGKVAFLDYQDFSKELIQFLRAAVLVPDHEIPDQRHRPHTWRSVADYNGLIARDFLICQNRVFSAKWMLSCRRVTMCSD